MYRLIDHKQNILRPKGDQSFHTVWALSRTSAKIDEADIKKLNLFLLF